MSARRYMLPLIVLMATTASAQQHPNIERGYLPDKSYQIGEIDVVNVFNGTVNLEIPLGGRYPVNGDLSYQFTLSYATNTWEVGENKVTTYLEREPYMLERWDRWSYPARNTNAGFGWTLSFGKLIEKDFAWTYLSPDGAQHSFAGLLHANNPAEEQYVAPNPPGSNPLTVSYTRDGTYLRLKRFTNRFELEFPDGDVHVFDLNGNLTSITDPFGNNITIAYQTRSGGSYAGSSQWVISDSTGRQHYVYFRPAPSYWEVVYGTDVAHERIDYVDLAAFDGGRAEYHFGYASDGNTAQPDSVLLSRRCPQTETALPETVRVALLESIQMPEGLAYEFVYDRGSQSYCSQMYADGTGNASGNVTQVKLTTGATIHFGYRIYDYPVSSGWEWPPFGGDPAETMYFSTVPGIASRIVKEGATVLSETEYEPDRYAEHSQRRIVRRKSGQSVVDEVRHYFTTCVVQACSNGSEYGLPFVREGMPAGGPFLSTQTFVPDAGGNLVAKRSTYLIYEGDGNLNLPAMYDYGRNKRVRYAKTIWEDGTFTDATYTEFDGLGHYRQTVFNGNLTASGNERTTFTNFNPSRGTFNVSPDGTYSGTFTMPAVTAPWLLNVYDVQRVIENGVTSTVESCFAANGFLTGRRTYKAFGAAPSKDPKDLLVIFTPDGYGNLKTEQYLGGDADLSVQAPTDSACLASSATDNFRIEHRYAFGSRKSSHFAQSNGTALTHFILDTDIDANTGLVKARRDASSVGDGGTTNGDGLRTDLDYDALGRLVLETPPNGSMNRGARRRVEFSLNSTKVEIFEEAPHDATPPTVLRKRTFELDGLGRVRKETRSIPGGATASRLWEYDGVGRLAWASSWGNQTPVRTLFEYDAFGRVQTVTAPDQTQTKFVYTGIRKTESTARIRTVEGQDTDATTTSEYDRDGRVLRVTDPDGIKTKYTYDVGGRLIKVCANETAPDACTQTRIFNYDNRGLLTSEQTPELGANGNGTASYKYDARGNVVQMTTGPESGAFDVKVEYDRAGRRQRLYHLSNGRTLKAFQYGTANSGADYRNGRLTRAIRYNWLDSVGFNVQVIEDYKYEGRDGRISNRVTSDSECLISASQCNDLFAGEEKRSFTQHFTYDALGSITSLDHPTCTIGDCAAAALPSHNVTNTYDAGWLKNVTWTSAPRAASIAYHDNGMPSKVTHANEVLDDILLNDLRVPRPHEIKTTNVIDSSACTQPTFTLQPQSSTITNNSGVGLTARAEGQTGLTITYTWYRGTYPDTSTVVKTETLASGVLAQFQTPGLSATTSYWVKAANSCQSAGVASQTATLTLCAEPSIVTQPQSKTLTRSQSHTMTVVANGSGPLSYQWYVMSGSTATPISGATSSSFTVAPASSASYRVTVSNPCGSVNSNTTLVTVQNPPAAPAAVMAISNGTTNTVTWSASPGSVASYQVQRQDTMMFTVPMPGARTVTDGPSGVLPGNAYMYRVRAIDGNGVAGPWSAYDLTTTVVLTDDPLEPGVTEVKGAHISQLRQAIDAIRARGGLAPIWPSYGPQNGIISLGHITQMQTSLNEGRLAVGLFEIGFTEVPLHGLMSVTYLNELRNGVK